LPASGFIAKMGFETASKSFTTTKDTTSLALASLATQYGEEFEPRKTRKKVEANRAT
jgi:hypothetical protein